MAFDLVPLDALMGQAKIIRRAAEDLRPGDWEEVRGVLGPQATISDLVASIRALPGRILIAADGPEMAEIYAIGGLVRLRNSTLEGWILGTNKFKKAYIPLTRAIKRDILPTVQMAGVRRLECHSIGTHKEAHRWLEIMGAKFERDLPRRGARGESFKTFAWEFD